MDSNEDPFVRAVAALVASTSDQDISQVLSIIKSGTEDKSKRMKQCVFKLLERKGTLDHLLNDENNMSLILSILADLCWLPNAADTTRRFRVLKYVDKILKSRRHDDIIIISCLPLFANFCVVNQHLINYVARGEGNLNIIESIVRILYLILEEDVPLSTA